MKLRTAQQISRIKKSPSQAVRRHRRRVIFRGQRQQFFMSGGPLCGHGLWLQAETGGTLPFRLHGHVGHYNQNNEWVAYELA